MHVHILHMYILHMQLYMYMCMYMLYLQEEFLINGSCSCFSFLLYYGCKQSFCSCVFPRGSLAMEMNGVAGDGGETKESSKSKVGSERKGREVGAQLLALLLSH